VSYIINEQHLVCWLSRNLHIEVTGDPVANFLINYSRLTTICLFCLLIILIMNYWSKNIRRR